MSHVTRSTRALMLTALTLGALAPRPAHAQAGATPTIITISVVGPNGAVLPGATVSATSARTQITRRAMSNAKGAAMIMFNDSTTQFTIKASAPGYLPWTGDVRRSYTDDRIPVEIYLKEDPNHTADRTQANAGDVSFDRSQLGAADAVTITIDSGNIMIKPGSADHVVYRTFPSVVGIGGISDTRMYPATPVGLTSSVGANGLTISSGGNAALIVEVPQNLKSLSLIIRSSGVVRVDSFAGDLSVRSAQGPIRLSNITGPTLVEARDGDIMVRLTQLPPVGTAGLNLMGRNGNLDLTLPEGVHATLNADAHNGAVAMITDTSGHAGNPMQVAAQLDSVRKNSGTISNSYKVPINGGGAQITLVTLNGNIIVRTAVPKKPE